MDLEIGKTYRFTFNGMGIRPGDWYEAKVCKRVARYDRVSPPQYHVSVTDGGTTGWATDMFRSISTEYYSSIDLVKTRFESVPPRGDLRWAAVDLDGTLAKSVWTADNPTSDIGDPIPEAVNKVNELVEAGYKIVIHTSRAYTDLENIERWLEHHGIPYRQVVCGKLLAAVYVDDRAIHADSPVWLPQKESSTPEKSSEGLEDHAKAIQQTWKDLTEREKQGLAALYPHLRSAIVKLDRTIRMQDAVERVREGLRAGYYRS